MFTVQGRYNTAVIFTDTCDSATVGQVIGLLNSPCAEGASIRIMPDCHAGAGCVIGTTMTIRDKVIPGLVGVDIGCGMLATRLKERRIDLPKFDSVSQAEVPAGMRMRGSPHSRAKDISPEELRCFRKPRCSVSPEVFALSLGTLGGGNHFWELDRDEEGNLWLVVHTGSRRSGKDVAEYYQRSAYEQVNGLREWRKKDIDAQREAFIRHLRAEGREREISTLLPQWEASLPEPVPGVPYEMAWCEGPLFDDYIHDMRVMQRYAQMNRQIITQTILKKCKLHPEEQFETVHNYIDLDRMILRKGAISARAGERVLIPINMRDGALICRGRGNPEWNESAPHGAGRLMSRSEARASISMADYRAAMEGIYTTCVSTATVDESPFAYKPMAEIVANIEPTVEIVSRLKPIYNFKAGG